MLGKQEWALGFFPLAKGWDKRRVGGATDLPPTTELPPPPLRGVRGCQEAIERILFTCAKIGSSLIDICGNRAPTTRHRESISIAQSTKL